MYVGLYRFLQFGFLLTKAGEIFTHCCPWLTLDYLVVLLLESVENKMAKRLLFNFNSFYPLFHLIVMLCIVYLSALKLRGLKSHVHETWHVGSFSDLDEHGPSGILIFGRVAPQAGAAQCLV